MSRRARSMMVLALGLALGCEGLILDAGDPNRPGIDRPGPGGGNGTGGGDGTGGGGDGPGGGGGDGLPDREQPRPPGGLGNGIDPVTLDQTTLFGCDPEATTLTPQRVWRISGTQFQRQMSAVQATSNGSMNPFRGAVSGASFVNYGAPFSMEEAELGTVLRAGRSAILRGLNDNKMPGCIRSAYRDARDNGEPADPLAAVDEGCRRSAMRYVFERLARRQATDEESAAMAEDLRGLIAAQGVEDGILLGLTALFGHPEALFRFEVGTSVGDRRYRLTANELGGAASLTLLDTPPATARVGALTTAMNDGSLLDEDVYRGVLQELMDQNGYGDVFRRFVREYFHYTDGAEILKPHRQGYSFGGAERSLDRWIDLLVEEDAEIVWRLLTDTRVVDDEGAVSRDPSRPGILNRQAWLVSFSDNEDNDPIHRGLFIREDLLCQAIPSIPIGVVPQLPDMPEATLRERLAEHSSDAACATCHRLMDPLGLTFEGFDHYGLPRDEEQGRPVDTSGEIHMTETDLDGPVADSVELVRRLAGAADVERCFIRHLFRFVNGRDETYGDACTLAGAEVAYQQSNGSLRATLQSLMTSETFLYRAEGTSTSTEDL